MALVIGDLGAGGAQRVLTTLANTWAARGMHVGVITLAAQDQEFFELDPRVARYSLGGTRATGSLLTAGWGNLKRLAALRRALQESRASTAVAFIATTGILTILAAVGLRIRLIVAERNDPARQSHGLIWDALRRLLYRHADLVIANSRGVLDTLKGFVPAAKLAFAPNPLWPQESDPEGGARALMILTVGRLVPQKAQDVLLGAFARVANELPHWRLCIIGGGEQESALRRRADELTLSDRIDWIRATKDPLLYYQRASLFVLPSRFEGTPNALMEAMSCGLPVVISNASPGPLELVEDGVTGLVVPVDDEEALAAAIRRLAQDDELCARLGKAARHRALDYVKDAFNIWEELLDLSNQRWDVVGSETTDMARR